MDGENNGKPYEQMDDLGVPIIFGHTHVNFNSNEPKKRLSCCRWSTAASTRTWFPNLATPDPQGNTTVPACCLKTNRISPKTSARKKNIPKEHVELPTSRSPDMISIDGLLSKIPQLAPFKPHRKHMVDGFFQDKRWGCSDPNPFKKWHELFLSSWFQLSLRDDSWV